MYEIDAPFLASCTSQERALQFELRFGLHEYSDQMWGEPENATQGEVHASNHPDYPALGRCETWPVTSGRMHEKHRRELAMTWTRSR